MVIILSRSRREPERAPNYYTLGGRPVSVWALYLRPTGPVLNLSFGARSRWSNDQALGFLQDLGAERALDAALGDLDKAAMNRYPPSASTGCSPKRRFKSTSVPRSG
jgi:hypothetical protein